MGVQLKMKFAWNGNERIADIRRNARRQLKTHNKNNAIGHANIIYIDKGENGFVVVSRSKKGAVKIRIFDANRKLLGTKTTKFSLDDLHENKKQISFVRIFIKFIKSVF